MYQPIHLYIIWYGTWTDSQKVKVRKFLRSLEQPQGGRKDLHGKATVPSVADWWRAATKGLTTSRKVTWNGRELAAKEDGKLYAVGQISLKGEFHDHYSLGQYLDVNGNATVTIAQKSLQVHGGPFPEDFLSGHYAILGSNDIRNIDGKDLGSLGFAGFHNWNLAVSGQKSTPIIYSYNHLPAEAPKVVPPLTTLIVRDTMHIPAYSAPPLPGLNRMLVAWGRECSVSNLNKTRGIEGKALACSSGRLPSDPMSDIVKAAQGLGAAGVIFVLESLDGLQQSLTSSAPTSIVGIFSTSFPVVVVRSSEAPSELLDAGKHGAETHVEWTGVSVAPPRYPLPSSLLLATGLTNDNAPSGDAGLDALIDTMSHEIVEAASNPFSPRGNTPLAWTEPIVKQGWYVSNTTGGGIENGENADLCSYCYGSPGRGLNVDNSGRVYNLVGVDGSKFLVQSVFGALKQKCEPYY